MILHHNPLWPNMLLLVLMQTWSAQAQSSDMIQQGYICFKIINNSLNMNLGCLHLKDFISFGVVCDHSRALQFH
jgi:hypothetical protein